MHMYLGCFKKKGVNVGNPRHGNTVSGSVLCRHDKEMSAKSAEILVWGTCRRHVAAIPLPANGGGDGQTCFVPRLMKQKEISQLPWEQGSGE